MAQYQHLGVTRSILRGWHDPTKKGEGYVCFDTEPPYQWKWKGADELFSAPNLFHTEAEKASAKGPENDIGRIRKKLIKGARNNRFYPLTKKDRRCLARFMQLCHMRSNMQDFLANLGGDARAYTNLRMLQETVPAFATITMPASEWRDMILADEEAFRKVLIPAWISALITALSRHPEQWQSELKRHHIPDFVRILTSEKKHVNMFRIPPKSELRFFLGRECWSAMSASGHADTQQLVPVSDPDVDFLLFLDPSTVVHFSAQKNLGVGNVVTLSDWEIDEWNRIVMQKNDLVVFAGSSEAKEKYWAIWQTEKKLQGKRWGITISNEGCWRLR